MYIKFYIIIGRQQSYFTECTFINISKITNKYTLFININRQQEHTKNILKYDNLYFTYMFLRKN